MPESRLFCVANRALKTVLRSGIPAALLCLLFLAASAPATAQGIRRSPNQDEQDGVNAGGQWVLFRSDDKMTGSQRFRFELLARNSFREDPDFPPRVELYCSAGKLTSVEFDPGAKLAPPNRPGFWGQPQMEVRVRIDRENYHQGWNWLRGRFLSMDKGTVRGLVGADVFNVEVQTVSGTQIAEFSPAGLQQQQLQQACGLKPNKR